MNTIPKNDLLGRVKIAAPCPAAWDRMEGDERVRFCAGCRRHVYNLSEMDRAEAEALIRENERAGHRLCVRLYQRSDGTVLTRNCPVGLRAARRKLAYALSCSLVVLLSLVAWARGARGGIQTDPRPVVAIGDWQMRQRMPQPLRAVLDWANPVLGPVVMGEMVVPPAPPMPPSGP